MATENQPLSGMRVLDLSQQLPGPYATSLLAELGAAVIKIEPPDGDVARRVDAEMHRQLHAGKDILQLDLKTAEGRARLHDLAHHVHVVFEAWRPGVAARLGADPATLSTVNPDLIVCSISGYGQTGPLATHGAHDINVQAAAGALAGGQSIDRIGVAWADLATGALAALAVSSAWSAGQSGWIDLSMLDVAAAWARIKPEAVAQREPLYGTVQTRDGRRYAIAVLEDHVWGRLCEAFRWDDWARDTSLGDPTGRRARADEIRARLDHKLAGMSASRLDELVADHGLPFIAYDPVSDDVATQLGLRGFGAHTSPHLPHPTPWPESERRGRAAWRRGTMITAAELDDAVAHREPIDRRGTPPATPDDAYAVQSEFVRRRSERLGEAVAGYKVAFTSPAAQAAVATGGYHSGVLLEGDILRSGSLVTLSERFSPILEVELAFRVIDDIDGGMDRGDIAHRTEIGAAVEVPESRYRNWFGGEYPSLRVTEVIADDCLAGLVVVGDRWTPTTDVDLSGLTATLHHNGALVREGHVRLVVPDPLEAVHWLAAQRGGLRSGQIVSSGTWTDTIVAEEGRWIATFSRELGDVMLEVQ